MRERDHDRYGQHRRHRSEQSHGLNEIAFHEPLPISPTGSNFKFTNIGPGWRPPKGDYGDGD